MKNPEGASKLPWPVKFTTLVIYILPGRKLGKKKREERLLISADKTLFIKNTNATPAHQPFLR